MVERSDGEAGEGSLAVGAITIVLVGIALGVGFNGLGLQAKSWGLPWIGQDRLADLPEIEPPGAAEAPVAPSGYGAGSDPMAVGAAAGPGIPEIPDLERPVQIRVEAVKRLFDAGAALFVDARESGEHASGHIPGSLNLPYDEVTAEPERIESVDPQGRAIVVYCGGGACELSVDLAWELIHAGKRRVAVYMGGFPEWVDAGYPVDAGLPAGS